MDFSRFYDCAVKVTLADGGKVIGDMIECYDADQNENGKQSIVVESMAFDEPVELFEDQITDIEIYG